MYKVLIIDDEVLVRVGLKTTINWEEIGFTIVADAPNGEQGYGQYKKHNPDLIITDIKMPKLDGLSLVEEIRKENQDVKILVLTCYDEFAYAQKAIRLGADDYILKSEVEDEELITVMKKIKNKIDEQNKSKDIRNRVKNKQNDMKRALINDLLKNDCNINDILLERCLDLEFPVSDTKFVLLNIAFGNTIENKMNINNSSKINTAILNITFDQLKDKNVKFLYNNYVNGYFFLLSSAKITGTKIEKIIKAVCNAAEQYFDVPLKVIYTDLFNDIRELPTIYQTFQEKIQVLFYENEDLLISNINEISFNDLNVFDLKEEYNQKFNEHIGKCNIEYANKLNNELSNYFKNNNVNPMLVKIFYSNLLGDIFNSYGEIFAVNKDIMHYEYYHYRVVNSNNLNNIINLISSFIALVIDEIRNSRYNNSTLIINRAVEYIKNNYDKKISLENIALELNISKNYLCSVFKEEIGETTSLYINKLRIEKAKKMLLKKDYRIKELFEEVGFSNQYYFSKVFKKITGMTITEYRDSKRNYQ